MKYLTSDTHFFHENILKFERKKFKSITEHNNKIMNLFEELTSYDELYLIGDVGNFDKELLERWNNLKCKKILIFGNHDKKKTFYREIFDEAYDYPIYLNKRIVLSHYPIVVNKDVINVHGHLHGATLSLPNYINANIHTQNYKLIKLEQVERMLQNFPKESVKFLEEWYAPYYKFTDVHENFPYNQDGTLNLEESKKILLNEKKIN